MNDDLDAVAGLRQGLVNGVVDHLVDQMMQGLDIGTADVHAGAAANGLQALKDLDVFCVVTAVGLLLSHWIFFLPVNVLEQRGPRTRVQCRQGQTVWVGMPALSRASTLCTQADISW